MSFFPYYQTQELLFLKTISLFRVHEGLKQK